MAITLASGIIPFRSASAAAGDRITDFNGDGYEDLVIGVPDEGLNHNEIDSAGLVNVIHGTVNGISAVPALGTGLPDQTWNQNSPEVIGTAQENEDFGYSVGAGDFNNDGYSDLAVGNPTSSTGGEVNVIYGSSDSGLSPTSAAIPDQLFWLATPDLSGLQGPTERFGHTLAAGDFNGDGYDDLAIGNPLHDIMAGSTIFTDAGAVNVIYGSSEGLSVFAASDGSGQLDELWFQFGSFPSSDPLEFGDQYGSSLSTGDYNGDGYDDLAIGGPFEDHLVSGVNVVDGGAVFTIYGSNEGLSPDLVLFPDFIFGGIQGIGGGGDQDDHFGSSLTSGDFDADGYDDLAVGIPDENVKDIIEDAGAVNVIYGSVEGLLSDSTRDQLLHQDVFLIDSMANPNEKFGTSLAAGDFNGDSIDDLAVGVPNDVMFTLGTVAGGVNVIYGSTTGLSATAVPDRHFNQNSDNVLEIAENNDKFGYALTAGDYNGDGYTDLAIGIPFEDKNLNNIHDAGAIALIYGSSGGLSSIAMPDGTGHPNQLWTQHSSDVNDSSESGDLFGWSLT